MYPTIKNYMNELFFSLPISGYVSLRSCSKHISLRFIAPSGCADGRENHHPTAGQTVPDTPSKAVSGQDTRGSFEAICVFASQVCSVRDGLESHGSGQSSPPPPETEFSSLTGGNSVLPPPKPVLKPFVFETEGQGYVMCEYMCVCIYIYIYMRGVKDLTLYF